MRTNQPDAELDQVALAARVCRGVTTLASRARVERAGVLTLTETAVLGRLWIVGELTPGELSGQLGLQPQSLTRTLAALEQGGQLRRTRDPSDGRQHLLAITPAGVRALGAEMRPRNLWMARAIERELSPAELEILLFAVTLMERLAVVDASPAVREP